MHHLSRRRLIEIAGLGAAGLAIGSRVGALSPDDVIFETDFASDAGYRRTGVGLWNGGRNDPTTPPTGWDAIRCGADSVVSVVPGEGEAGSNALNLKWDPSGSQPSLNLGKHLTGDVRTGYDELYIRYHVRLPNSFRCGLDGRNLPYWKWGRLWQNTTAPRADLQNNWTENRVDSHYVVWNFGTGVPYTDVNAVWGANVGSSLDRGSAGGERYGVDYFRSGSDQEVAPGYFESLWNINTTDRPGELENNTSQSWHTLEYRFKLATTPTSNDGVFEMWWDGVSQGPWARIGAGGGAPELPGIPTARMGSGFNWFSFFDNMTGWNSEWDQPGVDGSIWVNDVVVSSRRIGNEYRVGDPFDGVRRAVRIGNQQQVG